MLGCIESNLPSQSSRCFNFILLFFFLLLPFFYLGCVPLQITAVVETAVSGHTMESVYLCVCVRRERVVKGRLPKLLLTTL